MVRTEPGPLEPQAPADYHPLRHAVHYFLWLLAFGMLAFYIAGCASPGDGWKPAEVRWLNDNLK